MGVGTEFREIESRRSETSMELLRALFSFYGRLTRIEYAIVLAIYIGLLIAATWSGLIL
jgi:uncharacterized membrane protein YhaH (DUF805 family)